VTRAADLGRAVKGVLSCSAPAVPVPASARRVSATASSVSPHRFAAG